MINQTAPGQRCSGGLPIHILSEETGLRDPGYRQDPFLVKNMYTMATTRWDFDKLDKKVYSTPCGYEEIKIP